MPRAMDFLLWTFGLILLSSPAWSQAPRPAREDIGPWALRCAPTESEPCILRHRDWILPPGETGASAAVEIQRRGDVLVPVVTLRGMPKAASLGGALVVTLTVTIAFDDGVAVAMRCGSSGSYFACGPEAAALPRVAAQMVLSRAMTLDFLMSVPGMIGLPAQHRVMDFTTTPMAISRLLTIGLPDGESLPVRHGLEIRGFADTMLGLCGVPGGMAEAAPTLLSFLAKRFQP